MTHQFPKPPFQSQKQPMPGSSAAMDPLPDEASYDSGATVAITGGKPII